MMKISITLLLTAAVVLCCPAREPADEPVGPIPQKRPDTFARHDLRLTVGAYPLLNGDYYWFNPCYDYDYFTTCPVYDDLHDISYTLGSVCGDTKTAGAYSLSYMFSPVKWFSVGAYATYANTNYKHYDRRSGQRIGKTNIDHFLFTPTVRFTYLNRPIVRLYSQVGIGVAHMTENGKYDDGSRIYEKYDETYLSIQMTMFGVSVGRRLYGFAEVAVGSIGCLNAGIGYRF